MLTNGLSSSIGDILVATQLRRPENYRYNDLKAATKSFSEETKLGEGGFGDVYKVMSNKNHTKNKLISLFPLLFLAHITIRQARNSRKNNQIKPLFYD